MAPKATVVNSTTHTKRLVRSDQSKVETKIATRISAPPMVGVPVLERCVTGPSSRTIWPNLRMPSLRIIHGPTQKLIASAVSTPRIARSVR